MASVARRPKHVAPAGMEFLHVAIPRALKRRLIRCAAEEDRDVRSLVARALEAAFPPVPSQKNLPTIDDMMGTAPGIGK